MSITQKQVEELSQDWFVSVALNRQNATLDEDKRCIENMLEDGYTFIDPDSFEADEYEECWVRLSVYQPEALRELLKAIELVRPLSEEDRDRIKDYRTRDM